MRDDWRVIKLEWKDVRKNPCIFTHNDIYAYAFSFALFLDNIRWIFILFN